MAGCFIFHFLPAFRRAGFIRQINPLRHDAFEPKLARVLEDYRSITLQMLDVPDTGRVFTQQFDSLLPFHQRLWPNVLAIQFQEIERE